MTLTVMVSISCVEDEFGNVVGTWVHPQFTDFSPNKTASKPDATDCEPNITTTFHKNLTGTLDKNKDKLCDSGSETYSFKYNIKGGTLTITYDHQFPDNLHAFSGIYTYVISGNELIITDDEGKITVLTKE